MRWTGAVGVLLLSACGYRAGMLRAADPQAARTAAIDCLDVMVEPVADAVATGAAIAYQFGNRCDRAVRVDLGAVEVVGRFADGSRVALVAYDPDQVIRPGTLDARRAGREVIEYQRPGDPTARPLEVCLTLGAITGGGARPPIECVRPVAPPAPVAAEVTP